MLVAVGGLFTSCIDNEEPLGVKELRYAKAEYIRALKGLTDANAKVAEAEAAWKNAQADVEKANAAWLTAQIQLTEAEAAGKLLDNEAKRLKNENDSLQALIDRALAEGKNAAELEKLRLQNEAEASKLEVEIAKNNAKIEEIQNKREVEAVKAQQALAIANADLQNTLDSIAAYAMLLSEDEGTVVMIATNTYLAALEIYNDALADYTDQVAQTYIDTYDAKNLSKDYLRNELEKAKEALEKAKENKEKYAALDGKAETWKAELDDLKDQVTELEKQKLEVAAEGAKAFADYRMCFEAFREQVQEITKEIVEKYMDVTVELSAEVELPNHNEFIMNQWADYTTPFVAGGILDFYTEDGKLYMTVDADYEDVEGVLFSEEEPVGLKEIIETFRREKVIVDNEGMAKALADAQQAKKNADSIYFAHKAILEAGLMAYAPVADAAAKLKTANDNLAAAQAAYNKAKSDSVAAEKAAKTQYKTDTTAAGNAYKAAVKAANDAYDAAVAAAKQKQIDDSTAIATAAADFAYDINYFFGTIGGGDMDTTKVFPAIQEYAQFISQYNTPQDSVFYYNGLDADNNVIVGAKAIQDLTLEDMTATGLLGKYAFVDNFAKAGTYGIPTDQIFAHVIRILIYDKPFNKSTDINADILEVYVDGASTPTSLKDLADNETKPDDPEYLAAVAAAAAERDAALDAAADAYADALQDALDAYNAVIEAEHAKVAEALSKLNSANAAVATAQTNLKNAKDEFYAIYDSFWGYTDGTHTVASYSAGTAFADPADSLTVVYTEKTFVDPDDIVSPRVNFTFDGLLDENEELAIVLFNFDREGYTMTDYFNDPTLSYIFYNDHYNEFADRFFAQALLNFYAQYETNLATLDALEAAVNQLVDAYNAKKAEIEAAMAEAMADMAELTGLTVEEIMEDPSVAMEMIYAAYNVGTPGYMFEDFIDDFVNTLTGEYVYNNISETMLWGEPYPVGGKILEVMKECMNLNGDDFAAKYSEWMNAEHDLQGQINDLNNLIKWLDDIYAAALELEAPGTAALADGTKYDDLYEALMNKLDEDIEDAEWDVYELQKLVDTMDAGADYMTVAAELAEQRLQLAKDRLDVAKTNLDAAKAYYDEVIAKYLTK